MACKEIKGERVMVKSKLIKKIDGFTDSMVYVCEMCMLVSKKGIMALVNKGNYFLDEQEALKHEQAHKQYIEDKRITLEKYSGIKAIR